MTRNGASPAIVVTSINPPNEAIAAFAEGARTHGWRFVIVGDSKSPVDFQCEGAEYFDIERQLGTGFDLARRCPFNHYARKNVGYLIAIADGCNRIIETDDDNIPYDRFWSLDESPAIDAVAANTDAGWVNVYKYFTHETIWPRGLPLDAIQRDVLPIDELPCQPVSAPIRQRLADDNPDVDAIFRLAFPLPVKKFKEASIALGAGSWCPFNSQNTTWWREAFPLLYLPATCSFRMTDIWRSFVAQRIAWQNGWHVLFESASVWQKRNDHDLMKDFRDEVVGYLNNGDIAKTLAVLPLVGGQDAMADDLRACYRALVEMDLLASEELTLLDAWLRDLAAVCHLPR